MCYIFDKIFNKAFNKWYLEHILNCDSIQKKESFNNGSLTLMTLIQSQKNTICYAKICLWSLKEETKTDLETIFSKYCKLFTAKNK